MKEDYIVAIDPDVSLSGVSYINNNAVYIKKYSFEKIIFEFFKDIKEKKHIVLIEASWLIKSTFNTSIQGQSPLYVAKIAKNIGANHAVGRKLLDCAIFLGINAIPVLPIKDHIHKLSHQQIIDALSSYKLIPTFNTSNQDERDAIRIIINYLNEKIN